MDDYEDVLSDIDENEDEDDDEVEEIDEEEEISNDEDEDNISDYNDNDEDITTILNNKIDEEIDPVIELSNSCLRLKIVPLNERRTIDILQDYELSKVLSVRTEQI